MTAKRVVVGAFLFYAVIAALFLAVSVTDAADPRPTPVVVGFAPVDWPCLAPGWTAGDQWGPGAADIVPDAPPCPVSAPVIPQIPDTSTEPVTGDTINLIIIWWTAAVVIYAVWKLVTR